MSTPLLDVPKGHREHDREGQPYAQLHLVHAADEVVLEAEAVVDTVVDSFQCGAPVVAPMPARVPKKLQPFSKRGCTKFQRR